MSSASLDEFTDPDSGWDEGPTRDGAGAARSRWMRVLGVGVGVALVAVTASVLHSQVRDERSPEAAVLEYVRLIEAGDIEAASRLVPIPTSVDTFGDPSSPQAITLHRSTPPELLTNASYDANPGISNVTVEPAGPDNAVDVGQTVEVLVRYSVQDTPAATLVRAERLPDDFPALPAWKVVDSLAIPTAVTAGPYGLGQILIDDVPVSPLPEYPAPRQVQVETLLYPGVYDAAFTGSPYLTAPTDQIHVLTGDPLTLSGTSIIGAKLMPQTTSLVNDLIQQKATEHLTGCAETPDRVDLQTCPRAYRDQRTDTKVTGTLMGEHTAASYDQASGPVVTGTMTGNLIVTTPTGARNDYFTITVTVAFDSDQPATTITASAP